MMKTLKKGALVFCLLISMFLVSQVHADKKYFLLCTDGGLSIYDVPKDWNKLGEPVNFLPFAPGEIWGRVFTEVGFNSDRSILYTSSYGDRIVNGYHTIYFYKVPKNGDLSKIDKSPFFKIEQDDPFTSMGFNPNDGTFYTIEYTREFINPIMFDPRKLSIYNIDPDAKLEKDRCKKNRDFKNWPNDFQRIIFKPNDPTTAAVLWIGKVVYYSHRGAMDEYIGIVDGVWGERPGLITGFSPSGDIVIVEHVFGMHFYRTPKKGEKIDLSNKFGKFDKRFYPLTGFLDNEHFCVCSLNRVEIYKIPPCDKWTKNSISNESFQKIASYEARGCMLYSTPSLTRNEIAFKDTLEKGKPRKAYQDVRIITEE